MGLNVSHKFSLTSSALTTAALAVLALAAPAAALAQAGGTLDKVKASGQITPVSATRSA
jgi:hypothetical protein